MARVKPTHKIRAASYYFVYTSRNLKRIAKDLRRDTRTIQGGADTPVWTETSDACDYRDEWTFELQPSHNTERDTGTEFLNARDIYIKARDAGEPRHKLAAIAEANENPTKKDRRMGAKNTAGRISLHQEGETANV